MVGTPSNTVTPSLAMMSSAREGSKRDIRVMVDPAWMAALRQQVWPKAWKNGRQPEDHVCGVRARAGSSP